LITTILNR